jgi:hypothetical protein
MFYLSNSEKSDFFIQTHGKNAGKPFKVKFTNSVGVTVNQILLNSDYFYYYAMYLFQAGAYLPYLKGSVIDFITHSDIEKVLTEYFS